MKYSVLLGLTGLAAVSAHPHPRQPQASGSGAALQKRALDIEKFALPDLSSYEKHDSTASTASISSRSDYVETATQLVKNQYPKLEFRLVDGHYVGSNGIGHVHFKQTVHGIDVDNADFNVNIGRDGKVFSHGDSFYSGKIPENPPTQKRDTNEAINALKKAVELLNLPVEVPADAEAVPNFVDSDSYLISGTSGTEKNPEARLVYFRQGGDSELTLSWRVETDVVDNWLLTYVDASKREVLGAIDYVSDFATYQVYPWNVNDPSRGERVIEKEPWLLSASPLTWVGDGTANYTTTRGNNAIAQVNPTGGSSYLNNYRPTQADLKFEYSYSLTETDPTKYRDASISQLFFTANKYHDLSYVLGFNEEAGNFQVSNNNKGGKGSDFVILNAQDGSGTNNANFATPPDGQPGRMRMYIWDYQTPKRDCSFDASVIIHEYTHGISNRLTGGPANSGCLGTTIAGGMGEGWSDIFAIAIGIQPGDTRKVDRPMGPWISNDEGGIRAYPYSTSLEVNPQTYKNVIGVTKVHAIGAIWATMLFDVLWNLIDKHGKNDADFPTLNANGVPDDGKFLTLKIIQDALALQPCSPDFVSARDAILDADVVLTGGDNKCEIWSGFSKRGLGPKATAKTITEDFTLPAGCQ